MVCSGQPLELTKLSEYGPYSEASATTLRVPPLFVAPVQGEEEHRPPPGTVLLSVRKEGNAPPCMKPLAIWLTVPVHRASPKGARRYAMGGGGGGCGGGGGEGEGGGRLGGSGGAGGAGGGDGGGGGAKQSTKRNSENKPVAEALALGKTSTRSLMRGALPGRPSPCATMLSKPPVESHEPLKGAAAAVVGKAWSALSLKHASASTVAAPAGLSSGYSSGTVVSYLSSEPERRRRILSMPSLNESVAQTVTLVTISLSPRPVTA